MPLVLGALALLPGTAAAAKSRTWFVSPAGKGSACASNSKTAPFGTIQAALACASDGDVIQLAASGSTPYPGVGTITHNVTIKAASNQNARTVKIDASLPPSDPNNGYSTGLLTVAPGSDVQVQDVTVECAATDCYGSPVVNHGTLSMTGVTVTGSQDAPGVTNLSTDDGDGAARLTITDSTISGNDDSVGFADDRGAGGIASLNSPGGVQSQLTLTDSTVADNTAREGESPGAISTNAIQDGAVQLIGDTITANQGGIYGGLDDHIGPGGSADPIELENTIVAANTAASPDSPNAAPDCIGKLTDLPGGHNLIGDDTGCTGLTNGQDGDLVTVPRPELGTLADNGGPTDTVTLGLQSLAVGNADPATCTATDQRGVSRRVKVRGCDIGSYDTQGVLPTPHATWFVSSSGTGSACASNSKTAPFGTIQAALACASDGDVIQLAASGSTPYPGVGTINQNVTIKAASNQNARTVKIDASLPAGGPDNDYDSTGLLTVAPGADVQVQGVTVECAAATCYGSPVVNHGTLSMTGVTVTGAQMTPGITNLSTDDGDGAARLMIANSTIAHNDDSVGFAGDNGAGGIANHLSPDGVQPTLTLTNSTVADNSAHEGASPGAISTNAVEDGAVQLVGDTITGNQGEIDGGVEDRIGPGGTANPIELENTIIAANPITSPDSPNAGPDCIGKLTDLPGGHNLIGNDSQCTGLTNGQNGDQVGTAQDPIDPQLAPVALNGGNTPTAPPLTGSPAIGTGDAVSCGSEPLFGLDQRGDARNAAARQACDIGAYDTGGKSPAQTAPTLKLAATASVKAGKALSVTATATGSPTPALTETGALPSGVTFVDKGNGTGQLAGTPAPGTAGTYPVTVTADNGVSSDAARTLVLTVK